MSVSVTVADTYFETVLLLFRCDRSKSGTSTFVRGIFTLTTHFISSKDNSSRRSASFPFIRRYNNNKNNNNIVTIKGVRGGAVG